jgi:hypothetical protein
MALLATTTAHAQKDFSIRGGLTLYTVTESTQFPGADVKSLAGFTIGVAYQVPINEQFYIEPGFNFVKKGAKTDLDIQEGSTSIDGTIDISLDYLELPVLVKMYFGTGTKFFLVAGPSVGYGVGGKAKIDLTVSDPDVGTFPLSATRSIKWGEADSEDDLVVPHRVDFGLNFGAGVRINDQFIIDARYNLGLSNLGDDSDNKSMNRGFQFTVAVPLEIHKSTK